MFAATQNLRRKANGVLRQPWPVDRKIDLVLQGLLGRRPVTELCREAGISSACYYQWRQQFVNAARAGLAHPEAERHNLEQRVQQLKVENVSLQQRVRILSSSRTTPTWAA